MLCTKDWFGVIVSVRYHYRFLNVLNFCVCVCVCRVGGVNWSLAC